MSYAKRQRKKERDTPPWVRLSKDLLYECTEWKELTPAAKLLYLYMKAKYNGSNNKQIKVTYSELKGVRGLSAPKTISKASLELERKGWFKRTQYGGLFRYYNLYELTWEYDCLS